MACVADGAASMVGRYRGFIAHLKSVIPSVFTIHCIIYWEHLVSKNLGGHLNISVSVIIKSVNLMKSHTLQDRLFWQLCEENNEDFQDVVLHTEVSWLSKGNCLQNLVIQYSGTP